jgi:sulfur-carrier protein
LPTVHVPSPLLRLTGGAAVVEVEGGDVRAVLEDLERRHPGVAERLLDEHGQLHRFVHVFVRDEDVRALGGLDTPVAEGETITIVPAVAGGSGRTAVSESCR